VVDPLGLVAKGSLWYLVAAVDGEKRSYRVSRVQNVTVLEQPSARPPDFDLAAYWATSTADFVARLPRYPITVRIAAEAFPRLWIPGAYAQVIRAHEPDAEGWRTVDLTLQSEGEAISYALSFGAAMRILAPDHLAGVVLGAARELVASYERWACEDAMTVPVAMGESPPSREDEPPLVRQPAGVHD
jgi:predicted DNA-binding transcriptional regulator YafY